jgi:hypothetical protein
MIKKDSIFEKNGEDEIYCDIKEGINPTCQEANIFVRELWEKAHEYVDPNILKDLPTNFHSRFWEIYLATFLLEAGLNLQQSSGQNSPDICIQADDESKIWVEAVTVSQGEGTDAFQEAETTMSVPDDPIRVRLRSSFHAKNEQYKRYRKKMWVSPEEPYIIAINAAQVPSANLEIEIPRIIRCLLPCGYKILSVNEETAEITDTRYKYQGKVIKKSAKSCDDKPPEIRIDCFLDTEYSGISAVIYSCADVFNPNRPLLLFHNPLAINPLPLGFLKKGCEYWVHKEDIKNKKYHARLSWHCN